MNPETINKCYPCGKVETTTEFLMNFENQKVCFKCMIVIAGITFEEDLCVISALPLKNSFNKFCNKVLHFFKKSKYKDFLMPDAKYQKFLVPNTRQEIINIQSKSDCYINPAVFMPREKHHTYFVLMHRPFERN